VPSSSDIRQIPGGFDARIALLNDLNDGQQRSSRARGMQSRGFLGDPGWASHEALSGLLAHHLCDLRNDAEPGIRG
jgi:hypothetical protein